MMNRFIYLTMCSVAVVSSVGLLSCAPGANAVANRVEVAKDGKMESVSLELTGLT